LEGKVILAWESRIVRLAVNVVNLDATVMVLVASDCLSYDTPQRYLVIAVVNTDLVNAFATF
jgi:hypothetical protein